VSSHGRLRVEAVGVQVDELMNGNVDLQLVDTVADNDLDVLTSLIHDDVCSSLLITFTCKLYTYE